MVNKRLLLVKENFLRCSGIFNQSSKKLDKQAIESIFNSYDTVSSPTKLREPLDGFYLSPVNLQRVGQTNK